MNCSMPASLAVAGWITYDTQQADIAVTATMRVNALPVPASTVVTCHQVLGMSSKLKQNIYLDLHEIHVIQN